MAVSKRTFGLEFEMLVSIGEVFRTTGDLFQAIANHVTDYDAVTIGPHNPDYHRYKAYEIPRGDWIIVSDGSLWVRDRDFRYSKERMEQPHMKAMLWAFYFTGAEIVSPILHEGRWNFVSRLLDSLQTEPCSVIHNTSTSTHVHVGVLTPNEEPHSETEIMDGCTKVAAVWYIFETFISQLHPEHRVNDYCKRTRRSPLARRCNQSEFIQRLYEAGSPMNIYNIINNNTIAHRRGQEVLSGSRYCGACFENLQSDTKFTIEFRSHEGTKDFNAIECWAKLVMRLFDQAVQSDWKYIWSLVALTDGLRDQSCYGPEQSRPVAEWRRWVRHMHHLFLNFLAGERMRTEYLHAHDPGSLEAAILTLEELAAEDPAYGHLLAKREEELLIKRLAIYMTNRRAKFQSLHEVRFLDFVRWNSDAERDPHPDDYVDYPNPSGIVRDKAGKDIPINEQEPRPEELAVPVRLV